MHLIQFIDLIESIHLIAISDQFQSSFQAVSEQFPSSFSLIDQSDSFDDFFHFDIFLSR